jgi:hypothetical protein
LTIFIVLYVTSLLVLQIVKEIEVEGIVEKGIGKAKELVEDAKDSIEGAVQGIKNAFDKEDK